MRRVIGCVLVIAVAAMMAGCGDGLKTPRIAIDLPDKYNTPDGMALDADGNIILSIPNYADDTQPAVMLKIDADDKITEITGLPLHPDTNKVGPLGVAVAKNGDLYIADNQAFGTKEHKSRVLRVVMKDGKAVKTEVLITGFVMSNAVVCHGDSIYVTETEFDATVTPFMSGVYKFKIADLDGANPIALKPGGADEHLITKFETKNPDVKVGANGLGFNKAGEMFVCNFGDAQIIKCTFDADGKVATQEVFAEGQGMLSTDGLKIHPETGDIYVADFLGNAVHKIDGKTGKVTTLAKNGMTDGAGGLLDRPSEVCIRGKKLYIANIDLTYGDNVSDKPHTISVIDLD